MVDADFRAQKCVNLSLNTIWRIWQIPGRISQDFPEFSRIFEKIFFSPTFPEPKNIFSWPIAKFFGVLKSYESESNENEVYVVPGHALPPSSAKT